MQALVKLKDLDLGVLRSTYDNATQMLAFSQEASNKLATEYEQIQAIQDPQEYLAKANEWDNRAKEYTAKNREIFDKLTAERKVYTSVFDELKKAFTAKENEFKLAEANVSNCRDSHANKVDKIKDFYRKQKAEHARLEAERLALPKKLETYCDDIIGKQIQEIKNRAHKRFSEGNFEVINGTDQFKTLANYMQNLCYSGMSKNFGECDEVKDIYKTLGAKIELRLTNCLTELSALVPSLQAKWEQDQEAVKAQVDEMAKLAEQQAQAQQADIFAQQQQIDAEVALNATLSSNTPVVEAEIETRNNVTIEVLDIKGVTSIFAYWLANKAKDMDIADVTNTKISSMIVFAQQQYKATGEKIECDGLKYVESKKAVTRRKTKND